ncbi:Coenzyme F420 hydrogenase/dehydrogenase, beta subunit C-terminal domain [bacterium]|nr:Coenzyme F420 hydrogenase/dehydrogenase, beta subunit C-terminal domain [bacterium]
MEMGLDGFFQPGLRKGSSGIVKDEAVKVCPAINISSSNQSANVWGEAVKIREAWSSDGLVRKMASSGGIISTLAIYLVEKKFVGGVLHVGSDSKAPLTSKFKVSKTRNEILANSGSKYSPALIFSDLFAQLKGIDGKVVFIGKPCDIIGLNNLICIYPELGEKIAFRISFFCGGMPSLNATKRLVRQAGEIDELEHLRYRGKGWPGFFTAKFKTGKVHKLPYEESWGRALGRDLAYRCKICPDGIGLSADIVVGDAWETKDGYPSFEERPGKSFVILRNKKSLNLFNEVEKDGYIQSSDYCGDQIRKIQRYQYERRVYSPYRLLPVILRFPLLFRINNLSLLSMFRLGNWKTGIGNFIGSLRRSL